MQPVANPTVSLPEVNPNRHSGFDRRNTKPLSIEEILCSRICIMGGGQFSGIQKAVPEVGLKALCLFDCPVNQTTLAIPVCELTAERVRYELEMSRLRFNGWGEADLKDAHNFCEYMEMK